MSRMLKKSIIYIMSMVLSFQLVGSVFNVKSVYALENIEILGVTAQMYIEETPFKKVYKVVGEDGSEHISEYIKSTGKVYTNGREVVYSIMTYKELLV